MENYLKLIVLKNIEDFGHEVDKHMQKLNKTTESYLVSIEEPRFNNGEGKIVLNESVRGKDIYILSDVYNYSLTYHMNGFDNHYSPDDHFQDIKRVIAAVRGHASRITVIMPFLYASRQHRRKSRESLDCAIALQELKHFFGVTQILTVDVHDPTIDNCLPLNTFDNVYPTGLILKDFIKKELDKIDLENLIIISPDTGATERARFFANIFKCPLGIFSKQRDYTKVEDGKNKIISHDYAGPKIKGKDVIIVDDMISSGASMIEVAELLKEDGAKNIYMIATFSLFNKGIEIFNEAYKNKLLTKIYTTNFTYIPEKYKNEPWIEVVNGTELIANIINTLNKNESISKYIDQKKEVAKFIDKVKIKSQKQIELDLK